MPAVLLARQPHDWETREYFAAPPPRYLWHDSDEAEKAIQQASERPGITGLINDPETAIQDVHRLIADRVRASKVAELIRVLDEPVWFPARKLLLEGLEAAFLKNQRHVRALKALGAGEKEASTAPVQRTRTYRIRRSSVLDDSDHGQWEGVWVGEREGRYTDIAAIALSEKVAQEGPQIDSFVTLQDDVRQAVATLREQGFSPDAVYVPTEVHYAAALFGSPRWTLQRPKSVGAPFFGTWEGLSVAALPYSDGESVLVVDVESHFGAVRDAGNGLGFQWGEPDAASFDENRRVALAATTPTEVPQADRVVVPLVLTVKSTVGVAEPRAAIRLGTASVNNCYALLRNETIYHLPRCERMLHRDDVVFTLEKRLHGESIDRAPCALCNPT